MTALGRKVWAAMVKTRLRKVLLLGFMLFLLAGMVCGVVLALWTLPIFGGRGLLSPRLGETHGLTYFHDTVPKVPWSMHVVKVSRANKDLELHSMIGNGNTFAMATVSDQVKQLPAAWGKPVAAVNGDLYNIHQDYPGDPEGLQIMHGELVSGPSTNHVCFWIDAEGNPHRNDVRSRFQLTWPNGSTTPFGLNEVRSDDSAVIYTAVVGSTTRAQGGLECVLEREGTGVWLPLQVGQTYTARVRQTSTAGNSPLSRDTIVLSLGPALLASIPKVEIGAVLKLSTATSPELSGIRTAIGGSPTLVRNGKAAEWPGVRLRHPRTAIGWNQDYYFLVEVDGRQLRLSAGMTLPELADYMVKLGCEEAMNLDGGGSATCWLYGNVVNSPSQGRERVAANGLVVVKTPAGQK
jgi:phosphodiester glycosidase